MDDPGRVKIKLAEGPRASLENCDRCGRFVAWKDFTEEHLSASGPGFFLDGWYRGHRIGTGCRKGEKVKP